MVYAAKDVNYPIPIAPFLDLSDNNTHIICAWIFFAKKNLQAFSYLCIIWIFSAKKNLSLNGMCNAYFADVFCWPKVFSVVKNCQYWQKFQTGDGIRKDLQLVQTVIYIVCTFGNYNLVNLIQKKSDDVTQLNLSFRW